MPAIKTVEVKGFTFTDDYDGDGFAFHASMENSNEDVLFHLPSSVVLEAAEFIKKDRKAEKQEEKPAKKGGK